MRLRIVSDGTCGGTSVQTETGEEIGGIVTALTWSLDCNKDRGARVTLEIVGPLVDLDATGEAEVPE